MLRLTHEFRFYAGHIHIGGKKKRPVGYNWHPYRAIVVVEGEQDEKGMVVPFEKIEDLVGGWIEENWDYRFISDAFPPGTPDFQIGLSWKGMRVHLCSVGSPSAENLARELYVVAKERLESLGNIRVVSVTIWETKWCSATYIP